MVEPNKKACNARWVGLMDAKVNYMDGEKCRTFLNGVKSSINL